jgi:hypothetical protein
MEELLIQVEGLGHLRLHLLSREMLLSLFNPVMLVIRCKSGDSVQLL